MIPLRPLMGRKHDRTDMNMVTHDDLKRLIHGPLRPLGSGSYVRVGVATSIVVVGPLRPLAVSKSEANTKTKQDARRESRIASSLMIPLQPLAITTNTTTTTVVSTKPKKHHGKRFPLLSTDKDYFHAHASSDKLYAKPSRVEKVVYLAKKIGEIQKNLQLPAKKHSLSFRTHQAYKDLKAKGLDRNKKLGWFGTNSKKKLVVAHFFSANTNLKPLLSGKFSKQSLYIINMVVYNLGRKNLRLKSTTSNEKDSKLENGFKTYQTKGVQKGTWLILTCRKDRSNWVNGVLKQLIWMRCDPLLRTDDGALRVFKRLISQFTSFIEHDKFSMEQKHRARKLERFSQTDNVAGMKKMVNERSTKLRKERQAKRSRHLQARKEMQWNIIPQVKQPKSVRPINKPTGRGENIKRRAIAVGHGESRAVILVSP